MSTVAELLIKLGMDDSGLSSGMASSQSKLKSWGESLKSVGTKLTAGVTAPLAGAGLMAINWASALEQAEGKTEAVFGDSADAVKEWSKGTAQAYGFAQSDALAMASTYGALFKVVGMNNDVAADYSQSLIGLSADMAAFNDVSNDRASQALMAGLTGEYMSLRSMGIFLNEAAVSQEALTIAQADGREEITESDKVQARYNLIMKQTAQQQGQAAREAKSWSSRIPQLRAQLKNLGADLGKRLMPYALQFLDWIEKAIQWFGKLSPKVQGIILVLAALAAAVGPVLIALGFMLPAIAALLPVFAALLGPIGLVIVALAALVGIGIYAWVNDLWGFRDAVHAIIDVLGDFVDGLKTLSKYLQAVWDDGDTLNDWLTHFPDWLQPVILGIGDFVNSLHDFAGALSGVWTDLGDILQAIAAGNWVEALDETKDALSHLGEALANLNADTLDLVARGLDGLASKAGPFENALRTMADAQRVAADGFRDLATGFDKIVHHDYSGALLDIVNGFAKLAVSALDANTAVVRAVTDIGVAIAQAAPDKLRDLANNMRDVAAQGGPMAQSLGVAAEAADKNASSIDRYRNAFELFKSGNYGGALKELALAATDAYNAFTQYGALLAQALLDIGVTIMDWIGNTSFVQSLETKGSELIQGLLNGIGLAWPFFQAWATGLPAAILGSVSDMTTTLKQKGSDLLQGLLDGLANKWPVVTAWLALTGAAAFAAVGSVISSLKQKGLDLLQGLLDGLNDKWRTIQSWLGLVGSNAFNAVGSLTSTLTSRGSELIGGLWTGAINKFASVTSWLRSIDNSAAGAVGYLGATLYSAGKSLMDGLYSGISAGWESVKGLLSLITSQIPSWKGPPQKDARILVDSGRLVMQGFGDGLGTGWEGIERQLAGYTSSLAGSIDGSVSPAGSGGIGQPVYNVQVVTLEPGKWKEFLDNAMQGGSFARGFGQQVGLYGGTI